MFLVSKTMTGAQLTSWKDIANHLGVNVRTAQRWERERALPVRRLPGRRGNVAIDTATLDAWRQGGTTAGNGNKATRNDVICYRWPLGTHTTAEVRLTGTPLTNEQLATLRKYLDLALDALHKHS